MEKLTLILDASALSNAGCIYKLWRLTVDGYKNKCNSINIEFGTAFHKFRHIFREQGKIKFAEACFAAREHLSNTPKYTPKKYAYLENIAYLLNICTDYGIKYEIDHYVPVVLEGRFMFPYYVDDYIEVALAGTIDEIGKIKGTDQVYIADCKTTSAADEDVFLRQYRMSHQMLFYYWAMKQYAAEFPDTEFGQLGADKIGILIDGIFTHGQANFNLKRSDFYIPPDHIVINYERTLRAKLKHIIDIFSYCHKAERLPDMDGMLNGICSDFGLCPFFNSCSSPDEKTRDILLEQSFIKEQYDPLTHQA